MYSEYVAVYIAERFVLQETFLSLKMRVPKMHGFKSREGYNGAHTVVPFPLKNIKLEEELLLMLLFDYFHF